MVHGACRVPQEAHQAGHVCITNASSEVIANNVDRLAELKKYIQTGGALAKMQEFTAARLSVSKVSQEEWDFITQKLIEGFEEDNDEMTTGAADGFKASGASSELPNGGLATPPLLPNGTPEPDAAMPTIESDLPTTDTLLAAETAATSSKPPSRAGSKRPTSRSNSRPPSRNGNLSVPRGSSRGRSRTSRAGSAQPMTAVAEELEDVME